MADQEKNMNKDQEPAGNPYIREKIRKKRFSPARFLIQVVMCLFLAIIFGAAASIAFVVVKPWAQQLGTPEETPPASLAELPTYPQGTKEENSHDQTTEPAETTTVDESELALNDVQRQWIKNLISSMIDRDYADIDDLDEVDKELNKVYEKAQLSIASITGYSVTEGNPASLQWTTQGLIFYENREMNEILLLASAQNVTDGVYINVEMPALSGKVLNGTIKGWDHVYGLVVFSVSTTSLSLEEIDSICIMETGNSYQVDECDTVMFVGSPYGINGGVAVGRITQVLRNQSAIDSLYRRFYTDISMPENGTGFLINTAGELVGIILPEFRDGNLSQYGTAVGTEELKGSLNLIMNGIQPSLLGVYGLDVTEQLMAAGLPAGVYVNDVLSDGPAYLAGISAGDVITDISTSSITSVADLTACMLEKHLPGETVIVKIMRMSPEGYKPMEISVTLGAR